MKLLLVFALALATTSADLLSRNVVHQRDLTFTPLIDGRITNGKDAVEGQFPYQVGASFSSSKGSWWCGGSIIDNEWVVTAAHCTSGATSVTLYFGGVVRTSPELKVTVSSSNFIQHSSYNSITIRNDISLIKIPSLSFNKNINKVNLPKKASSYSTYAGDVAIASGWGLISDSATAVHSKLQYTPLEVITNAECSAVFGKLLVYSSTICVATPAGTSTCQGDSGGPLVYGNDLIGITSYGSSAGCESGSPAAFTRVTSYLDWISANAGI
ncbi:serine protease 1-like [Teleopsis dalmanni]|uniref:serine protease 1-like n=1 Tax=Teleopsis dalmanni TaxID=139649 RepID=UPI000D32B7E6|nr:serine protease 1-like [Teleopsis dalmanni]XP_037939619.1 serine protease 1-like [Teleopsis dalmanni]